VIVGEPVVLLTSALVKRPAPLKDTHALPFHIFHTPAAPDVSSHTSFVAGVAGAVSAFTPANLAAKRLSS